MSIDIATPKARGDYTRMSISLPPALKQVMDDVPCAVTWSAIARRAFEKKLADIHVIQGGGIDGMERQYQCLWEQVHDLLCQLEKAHPGIRIEQDFRRLGH